MRGGRRVFEICKICKAEGRSGRGFLAGLFALPIQFLNPFKAISASAPSVPHFSETFWAAAAATALNPESADGFDWRGVREFAGRRALCGVSGRAHTPSLRGVPGHAPRPKGENALRSTSTFRRRNCESKLSDEETGAMVQRIRAFGKKK
jgi:hypothetical protein